MSHNERYDIVIIADGLLTSLGDLTWPIVRDHVERIFTDFEYLHGDRAFADDQPVVGGIGRLEGKPVMVIGQQKGRDTREKIKRNFGMPRPEGYRKALRLMKLAEKFKMPLLTLVDTPGAYPGIGAEERGQSEAIARNLFEMAQIRVPIVAIVIGEGGSGGALALGVGDRVFMMEHSVYSVISPEGCAAILWKKDKNELAPEDYARAATALKLTAEDLKRLGVIDDIIAEPTGGMHNAEDADFLRVKEQIKETLSVLDPLSADELCAKRVERLYAIGQV